MRFSAAGLNNFPLLFSGQFWPLPTPNSLSITSGGGYELQTDVPGLQIALEWTCLFECLWDDS